MYQVCEIKLLKYKESYVSFPIQKQCKIVYVLNK